ncbi:MAG: hypothetical protein SVX43_09425 [Cyanobacteriota bacterium]|nr:hypothetical protein [Cyanobacteriota bacterium]
MQPMRHFWHFGWADLETFWIVAKELQALSPPGLWRMLPRSQYRLL